MDIELEVFSDKLIEDIKPLLDLHYAELTMHKEHIKLDPDWKRYELLAKSGNLVVITARDADKLVGYSVFFITNHMHYQQNKMANNDVLFLHPDYRKGTTGIKLIKESEAILKKMGIIKILWHIKFAKDFRNILYRMGYVDEDAIVGKILKD
jgi:GNAT superfamily N-acetyltransferase